MDMLAFARIIEDNDVFMSHTAFVNLYRNLFPEGESVLDRVCSNESILDTYNMPREDGYTNKIPAIREVRDRYGLTLKEAKNAVESPEFVKAARAHSEKRQQEARSKSDW